MRGWRPAIVIASTPFGFACSSAAPIEANEVVDLASTPEAIACDAKQSSREGIVCYQAILGAYPRQIEVYHARGITGANNVFIPDAMNVLKGLVEQCNLGRTLLAYQTDGVALLYIGRLNSEQVACIRPYERPGLTLQDSNAQTH